MMGTPKKTIRFPQSVLDDVDELVEDGEFEDFSHAVRSAVMDLDGVRRIEMASLEHQRSRNVTAEWGET